jgi:hypothetical protein
MDSPLTFADFSNSLQHPFPVNSESGTVPLVLIEAVARHGPGHGERVPFTLLFRGPLSPRLSQGTYAFVHPQRGALSIFIVPVGADAEGTLYEAVFS